MNKLAKICSAVALATAMLGSQAVMASGGPTDGSKWKINIKNNTQWDIWITYYKGQNRMGGQAGSQCVSKNGGTNSFAYKGWEYEGADVRFEVKKGSSCGGGTYRDDEVTTNVTVDPNGNMQFTAGPAKDGYVYWTQGYK